MIWYYNASADTFNTTINLQYYYNKSLYFSINSGPVKSGKKYHCSPLQSLDCKEFSTGYWQWCHLFLLDAVRQFGYPSLLIAISPSEWSFPQVFPSYLCYVTCNFLSLWNNSTSKCVCTFTAICYSYFGNFFYNDAAGECHLFLRYKSLL